MQGPVAVEFTEEALPLDHPRLHREAGVRNLEREIGAVCRKIAKEWLDGGPSSRARSTSSRRSRCRKYLGVPKYRRTAQGGRDEIGLANGLAVTMFGGDLLPAEVTIVPGKGKLTLTGKLGEVMQESAQAAMSYIRSRGESLGLTRDFHDQGRHPRPLPRGRDPQGRAERRASRWRPRSPRRCCGSRCGRTSR